MISGQFVLDWLSAWLPRVSKVRLGKSSFWGDFGLEHCAPALGFGELAAAAPRNRGADFAYLAMKGAVFLSVFVRGFPGLMGFAPGKWRLSLLL